MESKRLLLPPALLIIGALIFAVFVQAEQATTWTGPGFSMFSTPDNAANRSVHLTLTLDGVALAAQMDAEFMSARLDLADLPKASSARGLAEAALARRWIRSGDVWIADPNGETPTLAEVAVVTTAVHASFVATTTLVAVQVQP